MYGITSQGLAYLDEYLGSETSNKQEIKTRLLTMLEHRGVPMDFTELMLHIGGQWRQKEEGGLGWAPKGSQTNYQHILSEMVREGLVEES